MAKLVRFHDGRQVPPKDLREIFNDLLRLRARSDPSKRSSSVDKRKHAIEASNLAMLLTRGLAGWAIDQLAGSALSLNDNPNLHQHEIAGRSISNRDFIANPKRYRIGLAVIFRSLANLLPETTAKGLSEGMRALNLGEVQPIFRPLVTRNHGKPYTVWKRRKEAVLRVEFLRSKWKAEDSRKPKAQRRRKLATIAEEKVAAAFGTQPATVRSWRGQIPKKLGIGRWELKWEIRAATLAGEMVAGIEVERVDDDLVQKASRLKTRFTRVSLAIAGARYRNPGERIRQRNGQNR